MYTMRREEILNSILNSNSTLHDYILRIQFEIKHGDLENISGALLDYFIVSDKSQYEDRLDMLKNSMVKLNDDWLLFFYDNLRNKISAITPLPNWCNSLLTKDVQGSFDYLNNPYSE